MTKRGNSVGLLKDVYFLEELGTIVGYEYTDGFFSELSEGKRVINSVEPPAIGKDAIIVDANPM
ncbi:PRC-barrel domain-containing protein [Neobacillus sp. PS3-34]|uniref:PRC-barrel domain-containing protein n=1 Tax=Neobacillus sp. PS3-34 TaxID=3070678 RepID=UPI0027E02DA3|nr:PRC-barrel domain-containing protein [Neobacillus sp. PS3-34]WML47425.1 PRC-barrel domain-containing protein [Neobacillus sp. PS3-34]